MTCDEARAMFETDPYERTNAEIGSLCRHCRECQDCEAFLNGKADEAEKSLGPVLSALFDLEGKVIACRVFSDPEA